jgi:hypothetical protein
MQRSRAGCRLGEIFAILLTHGTTAREVNLFALVQEAEITPFES